MFEQHPVPQQISSYQFRLVGDMTLKQFLEVAGGAVVGLLIYSSPLPGFMRWPLIIVAVLFGAALAFLPIQDRPLEVWVFAFVRSIYEPTIFSWVPGSKSIGYFAPEEGTKDQSDIEEIPTRPGSFLENLEKAEKNFLSQVGGMLKSIPKASTPKPTPSPQVNLQKVFQPQAAPAPTPAPAPTITYTQLATPQATPAPSPGAIPPARKPVLTVPQLTPVEITPQPKAAEQTSPVKTLYQAPATPTPTTTQAPAGKPIQAQFSQAAAPPVPPEKPNTIVGQVLDAQGKIVEGAIMEIKDAQGRPVRALKSNKVGHFMIVTELLNGNYTIETEKEGFEFEPITFSAKGDIIQPVIIHSTNTI